MSTTTKCGHGKTLDKPCVACCKVMEADDRLRARVAELESSLSSALRERDEAREAATDHRVRLEEERTIRLRAEAEVARLRQAHWEGRAIGGFDNDGDTTPRAVVSDFAALILSDWREERASHDELLADSERLDAAMAEIAFAAEYLGKQEWDAWRSSDGGREDFVGAPCCPACAGMQADGHEAGCELSALLDRLRAALSSSPPSATKEESHG